jgi:hypothetical protein
VRSPLCEAVVRCQARRLSVMVAAAPLPAAMLIAALVLAPLAFVRLGHALAGELVDAISTEGVAGAMVLGPALAAAVAGAAWAAALPERPAFGRQIAAAPFDDVVAVVAVTLVPLLALALVAAPSLGAASVALGNALPGGSCSGLALTAAALAALPAGACAAEGWIAATRGRPARAVLVGCAAAAWLAVGAALGAAPLGPLAAAGSALRGAVPAWAALSICSATGFLLAFTWLVLAATRPPSPASRLRRTRRLVPGRRGGITTAVGVILTRRSDVRLGAAGAVAFGIAGVAVAALASAPEPAGFLLGTTTALLGSALCALATGGALLDGRWLWARAPRGDAGVARSAVLVALVGTSAPVILVGAAAAVAAGSTPSSAGAVVGLVVTGAALAVVAGALIPWQRGTGSQLTTFAAFAAIAVAVSLGVGLAAPRLVSAGAPDPVVLALVCASCQVAAAVALRSRLKRPPR